MLQEDKELLLKDLCARLPYSIKIRYVFNGEDCVSTIEKIDSFGYIWDDYQGCYHIREIKPYLFPMSSMTEEQEEELKNIYYRYNGMFQYTQRIFDRIPFSEMKYFPYQIEEFFNKNHIDYRGLIPMGLAKDATGLNIY